MQVILVPKGHSYEKKDFSFCRIKSYDGDYELAHIEEKDVASIASYYEVELDFEIKLGEEQVKALECFNKASGIVLYIGSRQQSERVDGYYDLVGHQLTNCYPMRKKGGVYWISCFSKANKCTASDLLTCIDYFTKLAKDTNRSLMVYSDFEATNRYYEYRSLTFKVINFLMRKVLGFFIKKVITKEVYKYYTPGRGSYEFYLDETVYVEWPFAQVMKKAMALLESGCKGINYRALYRQETNTSRLYNEVFYNNIDESQKIYVPLNFGNAQNRSFFEDLGINTVQVTSNYFLLYDEKRKLDGRASEIKPYVVAQYNAPILTRGETKVKPISSSLGEAQRPQSRSLPYKGNDVYVAIVSAEGVDFEASILRKADGKTRFGGMWLQQDGEEGRFYTQDEINNALSTPSPKSAIAVGNKLEKNTLLLSLIGGKNETYEGVASEVNFLFAKVNVAPNNLQEIFGGVPNDEAILAPDLLIGMWKLEEFARRQNKPIIFYIPYYTTLDSHDGNDVYGILISRTANSQGLVIVVPSGEEADKRHHQSLKGKSTSFNEVSLNASIEGQNLLGLICERFLYRLDLRLFPPNEFNTYVDLNVPGITNYEDSTIYCQGEEVNYLNGVKMIPFRIANMKSGRWRIVAEQREELVDDDVDLWLSQQALNPGVTLSPSDSFTTVPYLGNLYNVMIIAAINEQESVTLNGSGRGYTWDDRITPFCAMQGIDISTTIDGDEWYGLEGTEVAASLMVGAAANLCHKWQEEIRSAPLNSNVLGHILLTYLDRTANVTYPNPNVGNGIFNLQILREVLANPFYSQGV